MAKIANSQLIAYFHYLTYVPVQPHSRYSPKYSGCQYVLSSHPVGMPRAYGVGRAEHLPYAGLVQGRVSWSNDIAVDALPPPFPPLARKDAPTQLNVRSPTGPVVNLGLIRNTLPSAGTVPHELFGKATGHSRHGTAIPPSGDLSTSEPLPQGQAVGTDGLPQVWAQQSQRTVSVQHAPLVLLLETLKSPGRGASTSDHKEAPTRQVFTGNTTETLRGTAPSPTADTRSMETHAMRADMAAQPVGLFAPPADKYVILGATSVALQLDVSAAQSALLRLNVPANIKLSPLLNVEAQCEPTVHGGNVFWLPPRVFDSWLAQLVEIDEGLLSLIRTLFPPVPPRRRSRKPILSRRFRIHGISLGEEVLHRSPRRSRDGRNGHVEPLESTSPDRPKSADNDDRRSSSGEKA